MAHPSHWEHPDYKKLVYIVAIGMDVNEHAAKSWEHFAKRHDCDFKVITESSNPSMAPHWERYTVMERFPEYNQYLYCDADAFVRWDAPDFFKEFYTPQMNVLWAVKDIGSLEWTYNSMLGYRDLFPEEVTFDWWEYITTGFLGFDKTMKSFFETVIEIHDKNQSELNTRQYNTLKKGFDQTPVNYLIRQHHIMLNTLPECYSLGHLNKKDIFNNGMFVNIPSYVWQFNGIPKQQLPYLMEQLWNHVKEAYV